VVSARLFGDIIRRLPDDIVTVETDNYAIQITCGMSEFHIMGTDSEEFPDLPVVEYQNTILLSQRKLQMMINQTLFAVSTNESRPIHTGALFELDENGVLTMVCVDGYRLALRREKTDRLPQKDPFSFVVPASALSEASKICGDTDEPVEIVQGMQHIMFKVGEIMLISRRLEGEFLNYRKSIPTANPIQVVADRRKLMASIDRCSLIINEQQKSPLRCVFGEDRLEMRTATALGSAYDVCPTVGNGGGLEIGFNNKYLMDALKAAPADFLRIELSRAISPCILLPEKEEPEHDFVYMVLPVRLRAD
jgi:DNA polymerase-3 subunit beta